MRDRIADTFHQSRLLKSTARAFSLKLPDADCGTEAGADDLVAAN
jgi:hypothetical protein